jgi:TPR repeat protein
MQLVVAAPGYAGNESWQKWATFERKGVRLYQQGEYTPAFKALAPTAVRGYKQAQFAIAFMFLKGQHVEQSLILGMAWLGVAKESKIEGWRDIFDKLYAAASDKQKQLIDQKVAQYIKLYGMKTQDIQCNRVIPAGQRRHQIRCNKGAGQFPVYPFEMRWQQ